jgi:putative ABC transport system substrate-binding protein
MRRRDVLGAIAGAATWPRVARAQQRRMATIGYLEAGTIAGNEGSVDAFRRGLAETGYVEGRNVAIEFREAHNDLTRLPELARDLVRLRVDVIVTPNSGAATRAAKVATTTIPIVFSNSGDPIDTGLVTSLSHPGGNVTGVSDFGDGLSAKRLEFLKLLVPTTSVVGLLIGANLAATTRQAAAVREPARSLGIETLVLPLGTADDIDAGFAMLAKKRVDGFCLIPNILFANRHDQVVELERRYRIPGVYPVTFFVQAGGLMSYGSNVSERNYQMGIYAGLILNGRSPADLPIRRLAGFELAINTTTAKALGLTVPPSFLALADKVIE